MPEFPLPLTQLIHENLSILMNFSFSRRPLEELVETKFQGEWKYLRKALFTVSEQRAEKACLELAMFMRLLDDEENLSGYLEENSNYNFGRLIKSDGTNKSLSLRDVCNKIIHARDLKWDLSKSDNPILVCNSQETDK